MRSRDLGQRRQDYREYAACGAARKCPPVARRPGMARYLETALLWRS